MVIGGFAKEPYGNEPEPERWLRGDRPSAVGQRLKIQLSWDEPLPVRDGESSTWCIFTGEVVALEAGDRIRARVTGTSDNVPSALDVEWEAVLVRDAARENPWQLDALAR